MIFWKLALPLGAAVGLLASCGDSEESLTSGLAPSAGVGDTLTYAQVRPILTDKCVICHGEYANEAKVVKEAKKIYETVAGGYMPAPGVSHLAPQEKIDLLAWLRQVEVKK